MMWDNGGSGTWLPMALIMLVFWAVIVAAGAYALNSSGRWHRATDCASPLGTADKVLAERLAAGDIDAQRYRDSMALIHGDVTASTSTKSERSS